MIGQLTAQQERVLDLLVGDVEKYRDAEFGEGDLMTLLGCKRQRAIAILSGLVAKGALRSYGDAREVYWCFTDEAARMLELKASH